MNCAVVDITNKRLSKRDTQVSAASALARYPELFVANLANINSCRIQETTDVIFDNPGRFVDYGNGDNASMKPSFNRGQCTGKPSKNAGSKDTSSSNSGGGYSGQWSAPAQSSKTSSNSNSCAAKLSDGYYHPECAGGSAPSYEQPQKPAQQQPQQRPKPKPQQQQPQRPQSPKQSGPNRPNKRPNAKVQQELDAYLATLYGRDLARRDTEPASDHVETYRSEAYPASQHKHVHDENCKHKTSGYTPKSHYHDEDGDSYSYSEAPQYEESTDYAHKRVARERRWTTYNKRDDGPSVPRKKFYRGHESEYVQQAPNQASTPASSNQVSADTSKQVSAEALNQAPKEVSNQTSTGDSTQISALDLKQASTESTAQGSAQAEGQTSSETSSAYKAWNDMSESEKFDAFLRRMVELSNNMASLVKYAAASTVNLPWYPPASTYDRTPTTADTNAAVHRLARRDTFISARAPAQVYPGPSVGSISASGDATDTDEGFLKWFPELVQGLEKRQLVDPVTSEASAEANDGVGFFDALVAGFWKLFGDPFEYYNDSDSDSDLDTVLLDLESAPDTQDIPILLGEPDVYNADPDFQDFDVPDLDGGFTAPPQVLAPESPAPELLPGYEEGPDGPTWVGEGPDPLGEDAPSIIISVVSSTTPFPGDDPALPTLNPCVSPIPQVGFNSCWGGCNHTASEIAAHEVYLEEFAKQTEEYKACVQAQDSSPSSPPGHNIWHSNSGDEEEIEWDGDAEAEDAGDRRPRPGWSHPLIPYPLPENFTGPYPLNTTNTVSEGEDEVAPVNLNETETESAVLMPYQNKTLAELVSEILENPGLLASPEGSDDSGEGEEEENPLQEAADEAEEGITVPQEAGEFDPEKVESVADALPWFLSPGPVIVDGGENGVDGE